MNRYNLKLPEWIRNSGSFLFRKYYFIRFEVASSFLSNHKRALDIGCDVGTFSKAYLIERCRSVIGIDLNKATLIENDRELTTVCADASYLPFASNKFDLVIALGITEHVENEVRFIEDVLRVMTSQGKLVISIPIEVGIGGLFRHIAKKLIVGKKIKQSILDYSLDELLKRVPREKHGIRHKYYNYLYLIADLDRLFKKIEIKYVGLNLLKNLNPLMIACCSEKISLNMDSSEEDRNEKIPMP